MRKRFHLGEVHVKFLLLVVILVTFGIIQPKVFTPINIFSMLNDTVFTGIVALGMMVIIRRTVSSRIDMVISSKIS